jgi:hypothetical protein
LAQVEWVRFSHFYSTAQGGGFNVIVVDVPIGVVVLLFRQQCSRLADNATSSTTTVKSTVPATATANSTTSMAAAAISHQSLGPVWVWGQAFFKTNKTHTHTEKNT